jgi:hypothetical protein
LSQLTLTREAVEAKKTATFSTRRNKITRMAGKQADRDSSFAVKNASAA